MDELAKVAIDVGDTRPAMKFGLPLELLVVLIVTTTEIATFAGFFYALPMAVVWWACAFLVRKDFNAPRVILLWLRSSALDFEAAHWGGASVDPLPLSSTEFRGMPDEAV